VVDLGEFHGVSGEDGYFLPGLKGVGEHTDSSVAKGEFGRLVYVGRAKKQIVCQSFWQSIGPISRPPRRSARMRGMKLPRFRLRTLFVLIALISLPMGWAGYQLNWIRQRHEFLSKFSDLQPTTTPALSRIQKTQCPWSLRLMGELPRYVIVVPANEFPRAQELFPEATVRRQRGSWQGYQVLLDQGNSAQNRD
jgi:hypothetical protein